MSIIIDGIIVDNFQSSTKEDFIFEWLSQNGEDFVQSMWRAWKNYAVARGLKIGTQGSFRGLIKSMKDRNIIEKTREERTDFGIPRNYYTLVK
jgi:hypothetical protein